MHKREPDQQDFPDPYLLQKALHQLLDQIGKREQKIAWIDSEKTAAMRSFLEKEQVLLKEISDRDAILLYTQTQLTEREAQINEILSSRTWKIALLFQKIRVFLIPPESRRARMLRRGLAILSFPFKKTGRN